MKTKRKGLEERLKTNGYVCYSCGLKYLTDKQKEEGGVSSFHVTECVVCLQEKPCTHICHYNWLIEPKNE